MEVEDARGGRRAPVPHESRGGRARARGLFASCSAKTRSSASTTSNQSSPIFSTTAGETVDLGPPDVLPREARHEPARDERIVGGAPKLPADVAVEAEEGLRRPERRGAARERTRDRGRWASGEREERRTSAAAGTAPSRCRWSSTFGAAANRRRKARASRRASHARASYEKPFETGPVPLGTPPRERLWMRAAAFGVDLLLVAGVPLLLASAIVLGVYAASREAPAGLDDGFRAAQVAGAGSFPLPRRRRREPGKEALRAAPHPPGRGEGRRPPVPAAKPPLLVPGWNLIELSSLLRRRDGRRPGDRARERCSSRPEKRDGETFDPGSPFSLVGAPNVRETILRPRPEEPADPGSGRPFPSRGLRPGGRGRDAGAVREEVRPRRHPQGESPERERRRSRSRRAATSSRSWPSRR